MSQQTKKNGQPAWVKRILKLLGQAKAKDEDCDRFGADSHQYKLAAPASEEVVQKFEAQHGGIPGFSDAGWKRRRRSLLRTLWRENAGKQTA